MTEKEFDQIRNSYNHRFEKNKDSEESDGYFAYFKLRCIICLILFLGLVVLDQQIDIRSNSKVQQAVYLLGQDDITVEQCFNLINE